MELNIEAGAKNCQFCEKAAKSARTIKKDGAELFKTGTVKNSYPSSSQPPINSILQQPRKNLNQIMDLGADVNHFPQEMKVSQFKTNTMRNSKVFSESEKNIDDVVYEYEVVSEKQSLKEAKQRLQADFDGEVKSYSQRKILTV